MGMDSVPKALVASAIILALAMIVAADFLSVRYQIASGDRFAVYRLDRLTGAVILCVPDSDEGEANAGKSGVTVHCDAPSFTKTGGQRKTGD
jgi:hypothetical protein